MKPLTERNLFPTISSRNLYAILWIGNRGVSNPRIRIASRVFQSPFLLLYFSIRLLLLLTSLSLSPSSIPVYLAILPSRTLALAFSLPHELCRSLFLYSDPPASVPLPQKRKPHVALNRREEQPSTDHHFVIFHQRHQQHSHSDLLLSS